MERFIFTNSRGESLTFDYSGNYIIDSYSGIGSCEIIPITQQGYRQNGVSYLENQLGTRIIYLSFYVAATDMNALYMARRGLASIFNPQLGEATLTYTNDYLSKNITVLTTGLPEPTKKMGNLQLFTVELTAFNPLWRDTIQSAVKLAEFTGLAFPMRFNPSIIFQSTGNFANITNIGDVPAPITVEFRNGGATPTLFLDTDTFIRVNTTLAATDILLINTAYGKKTADIITASGAITNANNLIDYNSTFFNLPLGTTKLTFSVETESEGAEVYIKWFNYYLGV